jgi:hypothetical protein
MKNPNIRVSIWKIEKSRALFVSKGIFLIEETTQLFDFSSKKCLKSYELEDKK